MRFLCCCDVVWYNAGDRDGGRGGYGGGGDRFGDKKMGPGGDFNPEFQRVRDSNAHCVCPCPCSRVVMLMVLPGEIYVLAVDRFGCVTPVGFVSPAEK